MGTPALRRLKHFLASSWLRQGDVISSRHAGSSLSRSPAGTLCRVLRKRKPLGACLKGMVYLKSKIQYLVLAAFFFAALLVSFLPFQLMVGRYQVSPFWCLVIPVLGILLKFLLNKESFNTFVLPRHLPLFVGVLIASIHFTMFFIWFDSPPAVCSGPLLSAFPLAPTYLLIALPIVPDLLGIMIEL
jgi:hypothetical protein